MDEFKPPILLKHIHIERYRAVYPELQVLLDNTHWYTRHMHKLTSTLQQSQREFVRKLCMYDYRAV